MAAAAGLAIRISAQIAEFQKAFADTNKTLIDFKGEFDKTKQSVEKTVKGISDAFKSLSTGAGQIGLALVGIGAAVTVAIGAFLALKGAAEGAFNFVAGAVSDTITLGDELFTLSQQTGITVEALSGLKFVAAQTGTSLDTITGAVFKMSTTLGKGGEATAKALSGIGLSLADLRKQAPEQAFASILEHIGKIPSASGQAAAGVAIFGKNFKDISQLSKENLPELIKQFQDLGGVISTETAVASDMLGDKLTALRAQFDGFRNQIGAKLIPVLLTFVEVFGKIFSNAFKTFVGTMKSGGEGFDKFVVQVGTAAANVIRFLATLVDAVAKWAQEWIANNVRAGLALLDLAAIAVKVQKALDIGGLKSEMFAEQEKGIQRQRELLQGLATFAKSGGDAIRAFANEVALGAQAAGETFGASYKKIQKDIEIAAAKMRADLKSTGGGAAEGATEAEKAFQKLQDKISGAALVVEVKAWAKALQGIGGDFSRLSKKEAKEFLGMLDTLVEKFGSLGKAGVGELENIRQTLKALTQEGKLLEIPIIPTISTQTLAQIFAKAKPPAMILEIQPEMGPDTLHHIQLRAENAGEVVETEFQKLVRTLGDIGLEAGTAAAEAIADGIRTGDWNAVQDAIASGAAQAFGAGIGAAVDYAAPGFGRIAQPLAESFFNEWYREMGFGTAGRRLVESFAESMGGFDRLHDQMAALGAEGEALWIRLTQQTASSSVEAAQRAIAAIQSAFARQAQAMNDFTAGAMKRIKAFASAFKTATGESAAALQKLVDMELPELEMGIDEASARKELEGFINVLGGGREEIAAEFQRLGLYAGTAFAETLRDQGLMAAIEAAGPLFDELNALGAQFGLSLEGSAAKFAAFFQVARDNQDVVQALDGLNQMIRGAGEAMFLNQELFTAFGNDAVAQFTRLTERGVDANTSLALMQPVLQSLWLAQERFGLETDEATQALIDQAREQGIVGIHMQDVNEKILSVLLAIAKTFNADIPAGLEATARASSTTARQVESDFKDAGRKAQDALADIEAPPITVDVHFDIDDLVLDPDRYHTQPAPLAEGGIVRRPTIALIGERGPEAVLPWKQYSRLLNLAGLEIPALQHGAIVRSPTLALIGEGGPEIVAPLDRLGSIGSSTTVILEVDGRTFAEVLVPHLPGEVTRYGVGLT